jgi:hypothetical protein
MPGVSDPLINNEGIPCTQRDLGKVMEWMGVRTTGIIQV